MNCGMNCTCGCCEGTELLTPMTVANRPGLSAIGYRIGTHSSFLETMLARLSGTDLAKLGDLSTRDPADPSIALLDAWATIADVLTFYQERLANEGYLRTAIERRSVLELARLIGYRLRPGVAASVYLAYTLEKESEPVVIPAGSRVQSIPAPGELPQTFESSDDLEARVEWNMLEPRITRPQFITSSNARTLGRLYLQGVATNLKPNSPLLLVFGSGAGEQELRFVQSVVAESVAGRTLLNLVAEQTQAAVQNPGNLVLIEENAVAMEKERISIAPLVLKVVEAHLELADFGVTSKSQTAKRVIELLERVESEIMEGIDEKDLRDLIEEEILPGLEQEHALAVERRFRTLAPWTGSVVTTLQKVMAVGATPAEEEANELLLARLRKLYIPQRCAASAGTTPPPKEGGRGAGILLDLIGPTQLGKPASLQPANAAKLQRSPAMIYGTAASGPASIPDVAPQLLVAFKPAMKRQLYTAWGNAAVTPDATLKSVEALRVKASPFGHNAPLQAIFDDNIFQRFEEWPLATTTVETTATLIPIQSALDGGIQRIDVDVELEGRPASVSVTMNKIGTGITLKETRTVGGINVSLTKERKQIGEQAIGDVITVVFEELKRTIVLSVRDTTPSKISAEVDGNTIILGFYSPSTPMSGKFGAFTAEAGQGSVAGVAATRVSISGPGGLALDIIDLDTTYDLITPESWIVIDRPGVSPASAVDRIIARVKQVSTISRADYGITGKVTRLKLDRAWLSPTDTMLTVIRGTTVYAQSEPLALADEPVTDPICGATIEMQELYDGLKPGRWLIITGERSDIPSTTGVISSELVMLLGASQGITMIGGDDDDTSNGVEGDAVHVLVEGERVRDRSMEGRGRIVTNMDYLKGGARKTVPLPGDKVHTTLQLANALAYCYKRETVKIYGNVVKATHGETRSEVLGSGDGSRELQQFGLAQFPLTYVAAPTRTGVESTLEVRINNILWHEVETICGLGPSDRSFITKTDDENKTKVIFGNGREGARLPTGVENVTALYRNGIGAAGNVEEEQISLLMTKPLGVKEVINPLRASGGADPEGRDQARRNAPLAVMSLDRLVSVQDYADFARTFAGIGKAAAARVSDGRRQVVYLTIAGENDIPIDKNSDLYKNLREALRRFGDPYMPVQIEMRDLKLLVTGAKVSVHPDYLWESVEADIRSALLDTFSFDRRDLGQDVPLSEVIAAIQGRPGVLYVDVDLLDGIAEESLTDGSIAAKFDAIADARAPKKRVVAEMTSSARVRPAQLITLSPTVPDTLILTELTA